MSTIYEEQIDIQRLSLKITSFHLTQSLPTINQVKWLIKQAAKILKQSHTVLNLSLPVKIVGDICGHYQQLTKLFETVGNPSHKNYLFLGNYVGKGNQSIESLITLLFYKIKYPETFFLLRGRFQVAENNFMLGFYDECVAKYNKEIWTDFNQMFTYLPLAAVIDKQVYCVSSGLMPQVKTIQQLKNVNRTQQMIQIPQIISLLTSKPKQPNRKKSAYNKEEQFSSDMVVEWMRENNFSLMIRSNQVLQEGIQFSIKNLVLSICSVPNFMNVGNLGVVVNINENCVVSFQVMKSSK